MDKYREQFLNIENMCCKELDELKDYFNTG